MVKPYVDDLTVIMHDPKAFFDNLSKRGFGLKGVTENPDVFLGGSVGRNPDSTLWWGAKQYIARCNDTYERIMGEKAVPRGFPMPEKSQLELDESSELANEGRSKYQSLIGCIKTYDALWILKGLTNTVCVESHLGQLGL
jgi:hypothetical protein